MIALVSGIAATGAQSGKAATGAPASSGTVTGVLTMGAAAVKLTHVYAAGPVDGDKYVVELTDQALPEAALDAELKYFGGQRLLRSGTAQGLLLYVDAKGFVLTAIPFAGEVRGSKMLASAGSLPSFKVAAGQVTGTGKMTAEDTNQGWSYQAQFTAPLRPAK
jgi:hypothetical protein